MTRRLVPPASSSVDRSVRIPPHIEQQRKDLDAAIAHQLGRVSGLARSKIVKIIEGILDRTCREISTIDKADNEQYPRSSVFSEVVVSRDNFEAAEREFKNIRQYSFGETTEVRRRYLDILYSNIFERKSYEELEQQFSLSKSNIKASIFRGRWLVLRYASGNLRQVLRPNIKIKIV